MRKAAAFLMGLTFTDSAGKNQLAERYNPGSSQAQAVFFAIPDNALGVSGMTEGAPLAFPG
jgi:hypothetical protein